MHWLNLNLNASTGRLVLLHTLQYTELYTLLEPQLKYLYFCNHTLTHCSHTHTHPYLTAYTHCSWCTELSNSQCGICTSWKVRVRRGKLLPLTPDTLRVTSQHGQSAECLCLTWSVLVTWCSSKVGCWSFTSWQHLWLVISGCTPTCNKVYSWWLYSAAALGDQTASIMTRFTTESYYLNTELASPCIFLLMLITWLGSDKYQFYKSLLWLDR